MFPKCFIIGTARPIQRKLTSQLQTETESEEEKQKKQEHLDLTADLTQSLLPVLLEVYSNSAGPGVRHNCIQALLRMVYHSNMVILKGCIHVPLLSSQIAGMLSSGDLRIIVGALQMSELLLQKMPDEFGVHFRREGVLHQVLIFIFFSFINNHNIFKLLKEKYNTIAIIFMKILAKMCLIIVGRCLFRGHP